MPETDLPYSIFEAEFPPSCPTCGLATVESEPFCTRCGFDLRFGELERPRNGKCWFCEQQGPLSDEHIIPKWIIQEANITQRFMHHVGRPRDIMSGFNGNVAYGKGRLANREVIQKHSAPIACRRCNNGWMSTLQRTATAPLRQLLRGDFSPLSESDRATVARWVAVATCSAEYYNGMRLIPQYIRTNLMLDGLPAGQWLISMFRPTDESQNGAVQIGGGSGKRNSRIDYDSFLVSAWICFGQIGFHSLVCPTTWQLWQSVGQFPKFQDNFYLRNVWPLMSEERHDRIGNYTAARMIDVQHYILQGKLRPDHEFTPSEIHYLL